MYHFKYLIFNSSFSLINNRVLNTSLISLYTQKQSLKRFCISRPPALVLIPNLCLPVLVLNLYLQVLAYTFITIRRPKFAYIHLVSSIGICIYDPGLRFCLIRLGPKFTFTLLLVVVAVVVVISLVIISLK